MSDVRISTGLPGAATVVLARTAKRNALDTDFARDIAGALDEVTRSGARVAVLRSDGPVFCAGVDVSEPIRLDEGSPELIVADALSSTPLFVVTVVEGPALAGGLMLAALSPVVLASTEASFWLPERALGLFPGRVLAYLEQVMPSRQAFHLGLTEQRISAESAERLGLVGAVAAPDSLESALDQTVGELLETRPGFLEAARDAWRDRFTGDRFRALVSTYDALLRRNLEALENDLS